MIIPDPILTMTICIYFQGEVWQYCNFLNVVFFLSLGLWHPKALSTLQLGPWTWSWDPRLPLSHGKMSMWGCEADTSFVCETCWCDFYTAKAIGWLELGLRFLPKTAPIPLCGLRVWYARHPKQQLEVLRIQSLRLWKGSKAAKAWSCKHCSRQMDRTIWHHRTVAKLRRKTALLQKMQVVMAAMQC